MKVLLISSIDFPVSSTLKHAGVQRVVLALTKELQLLGNEVTVCCSGDSDELEGARYATVERALASPPERPNANIYIDPEEHERHFGLSLKRVLSEEVDIVHDHGGLLLSDSYRRYESVLRMPILTTLHGAVTADRHLEECRTYRKRTARNVFFSCVSRHQAELYRHYIDISAFIHNGIFVENYNVQRQKKDYLFNLGRIMRRKGQDTAIKVAERTGRKQILAGPIMEPDYFDQFRPRVRLMPNVGTIPVTSSYLAEVVESVLACPEPVVYVGELDDAQKDVWFGHASAFLMPIRWDEPLGLVLLEAMACGTPVIAFNRGAVSEAVANNKTGFIADTIDEMVDAIGKVGQIDPLSCRRHVKEHFDSKVMSMKYVELYKRLLATCGSRCAVLA